MTGAQLLALLPLIIAATVTVGVMMVIAFRRHHRLTLVLTTLGLVLVYATLPLTAVYSPVYVTPLLVLDDYAVFFMGLILLASIATALLTYGYLEARSINREELYLLLLLATLGALVLLASAHFASFFLGLELLSVSLFAMIAYSYTGLKPLEAGIKYLILSGVSSSFLLLGMALLYAELGTLAFDEIGERLAGPGLAVTNASADFLIGTGLIIVGVGFKLSVVPFHMWTPDVYEGAPAPVTAYLATVSKGAILVLLLRYFVEAAAYELGPVMSALGLIAAASMIVGNLLALLQNNVKRILAYSSIAHLGYLLVAFLASGRLAVEAVSYYLVAYFIMTLGAFGIITLVSRGESDTDALDEYRGLFWHRPWLAGAFTAMLLSLAGIPLTAGFIGKFYVFAAGVDAALWLLVMTLVVSSVIGLFYYLRIIIVLYSLPAEGKPVAGRTSSLSVTEGLVLGVLVLLLIGLGVYPAPIIEMIQTMAVSLI